MNGEAERTVAFTVNGSPWRGTVEVRQSLADVLREAVGLTGTHLGCEHGVCGACTVLVDGRPVRSCLMLAVQADGAQILTVEGLAPGPDQLHPLQEAFWNHHALQCGFCTPGMLMTAWALLQEHPQPTRAEIQTWLSGNICRCTGYQNIVEAVEEAAVRMAGEGGRA
ncbi:MAG: (2Fe-2S)-binding protein [Firmicutes bacterium]|nr:(2Fe-2S)-binding protein [Alicyclobacillaceae bacterium]MCL6496272.1 (2Fe-2S)-binding protein [Bacillota bacterium]